MKMHYPDITVIVHGPVIAAAPDSESEGMTLAAIRSVRSVLPGAKVVLSTWAGSETEGLGADRVICSADPGGRPYARNGRLNNVNRQIVAMSAALDVVETGWTLKLRSDSVLTSPEMVQRWGRCRVRHPHMRVFDERVITSSLLTYDARACFRQGSFTPWLFHVNDMVQFGLTCDMRRLWCIPRMPESDFTFFTAEELAGRFDTVENRRVPEDYVWTTALAGAGFASNDSWADFSPALIPLSELSIVNNFELLDHDEMGFVCLKYPDLGHLHHLFGSPFIYSRRWLECYRTYCDPAAESPPSRPFSPARAWRSLLPYLDIPRVAMAIKTRTRGPRRRAKNAIRRLVSWR